MMKLISASRRTFRLSDSFHRKIGLPLLLGAFLISLSSLLAENGNPQGGQARFSVKFYLVAMLFVIFDIEVVFLYPWAAVFRDQIDAGETVFFWSMLGFVVILFIAYLYALKKGALEWRS